MRAEITILCEARHLTYLVKPYSQVRYLSKISRKQLWFQSYRMTHDKMIQISIIIHLKLGSCDYNEMASYLEGKRSWSKSRSLNITERWAYSWFVFDVDYYIISIILPTSILGTISRWKSLVSFDKFQMLWCFLLTRKVVKFSVSLSNFNNAMLKYKKYYIIPNTPKTLSNDYIFRLSKSSWKVANSMDWDKIDYHDYNRTGQILAQTLVGYIYQVQT